MKKRIISIIVALIIVVPIYIIGGVFFDAGVGILAAIAFFETLGLKDSHKPYPTYIHNKLCMFMPIVVNTKPAANNAAAILADNCMFFSTILPPNAAPIPRKNIDKENANCTSLNVQPITVAISVENNENA